MNQLRTIASGHTTAEQTDLFQGSIFVDLTQGDFQDLRETVKTESIRAWTYDRVFTER